MKIQKITTRYKPLVIQGQDYQVRVYYKISQKAVLKWDSLDK